MSDPLAPLRAKFIERCVGDEALLAAADPEAPSEELRLAIHRLAGAAGVFGQPHIGDLARVLDDQLHESGRMGVADRDALVQALRALRA
jgi:HPt (histidine-containing phosphotransfer) domain-containing protein